jgi:hypothetical protein
VNEKSSTPKRKDKPKAAAVKARAADEASDRNPVIAESERLQIKRLENREFLIRAVWRPLAMAVGCAIPIAASTLPAKVLAGKQTGLNVQLAFTATVVVSLAGVGATIWGNWHRKRANRLDIRNKELSREVKELQGRLRANNLSDEVSG